MSNRVKRFEDFLLEKVYLSKTIFSKYNLIVDPISKVGYIDLEVRGFGEIKIEMEKYGNINENVFILRSPNVQLDINLFKNIINDIIYVFNKNKLNYKFNLLEVKSEKSLNPYALIESNKRLKIEELERISQTTKITNAKITDQEDLDKLVYKTN